MSSGFYVGGYSRAYAVEPRRTIKTTIRIILEQLTEGSCFAVLLLWTPYEYVR